jgi:hypothetical protein
VRDQGFEHPASLTEHATQSPDRQALSVPHRVPSGIGVPVSWQADVPVTQLILPVWQGLLGVHALSWHSLSQVPFRHAARKPQAVPFG